MQTEKDRNVTYVVWSHECVTSSEEEILTEEKNASISQDDEGLPFNN